MAFQFIPIDYSDEAHKRYAADSCTNAIVSDAKTALAQNTANTYWSQAMLKSYINMETLSSMYQLGYITDTELDRATNLGGTQLLTPAQVAHIKSKAGVAPRTYIYSLEHTDHRWDEGVVITPATAQQSGVKRYTCTLCGTTRDEPILYEGS